VEEEQPPQYTNQQVINAFYYAAIDLGLTRRWSLMSKAGLSLSELAADRRWKYTGTPIDQLPNLTAAEKAAIQVRLDEQLTPASTTPSARDSATASLGWNNAAGDDDLRLDLILGVQEEVLQGLRRNSELLALLQEQISGSRAPDV
jgi:hypothetical protein